MHAFQGILSTRPYGLFCLFKFFHALSLNHDFCPPSNAYQILPAPYPPNFTSFLPFSLQKQTPRGSR